MNSGSKRVIIEPEIYERSIPIMSKKLSWEEICRLYPNQEVGLTDVEWDNGATVKSAVVSYSERDTPKDQIVSIAIMSNGEVVSENTTPETVAPVGIYSVC
jgi:hypothetical protein